LVRQRLEGGYKLTALDYVRAMQKRSAVRAAFARAFQEVDALVGATLPTRPPRIEEHHVTLNGQRAHTIDSMTRVNAPQNMAGIPSLTVPAGLAKGMPTGVQLMGPASGDAVVLALGGAFQRATDHHLRRPGAPLRRGGEPDRDVSWSFAHETRTDDNGSDTTVRHRNPARVRLADRMVAEGEYDREDVYLR
jgi:hypothetical protein